MTDIIIPRYVKGKEFYADSIEHALENMQKEGYNPLFMPELAEVKFQPANKDMLHQWHTSSSTIATSRIKGEPISVIAHVDNYFNKPKNVARAIKTGLIKGAGIMPENEFQKLVDLDEIKDGKGNRLVYAFKGKAYEKLRDSSNGVINIEDALEHPIVMPFIGSEERAKSFLAKYKEAFGNKIGIWHSDDLTDKPLGRLLYLGDLFNGSLDSNFSLDNDARFVGSKSAEGASEKIFKPGLEQVLRISEDYIPRVSKEDFIRRLRTIYG